MSKQIIIIDSAEALAEQIAEKLSMNAPHVVAEIASCLHPVEVPSEAGKLVQKLRTKSWITTGSFPYQDFTFSFDKAAALITARDAAIRAEANKLECERDHLIEAAKRYMKAYGPGYSTTDTLAYDALTGVLNAICHKEVVG